MTDTNDNLDPAVSPNDPPSNDLPDVFEAPPEQDLFEELVGPGKKFASPEALARGKVESDNFIKKLEGENSELRLAVRDLSTKADTSGEMRGLLDRLMQGTSTATGKDTPPPSKPPAAGTKGDDNQIPLTREDVVKLLRQSERDKVATANRASANKLMHETYGDKAPLVISNKARDLGITVDQLKALAESSPKAFSAMLGLDAEKNTSSAFKPNTTKGTVNTEALNHGLNNPAKGGLRGQKFYDDLKNKIGIKKFVFDPRIQVQMHKDIELLGDEFANH